MLSSQKCNVTNHGFAHRDKPRTPMPSPMSTYSKILDYRSKIQVFHSLIQDFQEKFGLSIDNPGFSTFFFKSWTIKSQNLEFSL